MHEQLEQAHKRIAELETKGGSPQSTGDINKAASSLPLKSELEVLIVFLREVMKPRQLASTLPSCDKTSNLTLSDCVTLARAFDYLSKTSDSNEDAVGEYLEKFPAMRDMHERNPVLEEALVFMSVRLANDGKKYAAVRLFGGALLSSFDTMTDIYMIWTYYSTGENGFAIASLISLHTNIFGQLLIVYFQNRKHPSNGRLFKEILYTLSFSKPGVDAYRVAIGAEHEVGSIMDPKNEMMLTKGLELFTEAIPGALIQTYAFLTGSAQSNAAIFSLVMSIFTASFTATGVSFDKDIDKHSRAHTPDFYGFVPDSAKKKVKVFMSMFLISACQLTAKALACALCAVESSITVAFYLLGEILLFFAYKLLRRDFNYWLPVYGMTGVVLSTLIRINTKTITDFTALMQFRHPYELGGTYWAFTLLSMPVVCFYFGSRYLAYVDSEAGKARGLTMVLDATQVYGLVGGLLVVQVATFVFFLKNINPKFINTFYSTKSGNDFTKEYFLDHDDDEHKILVLNENRNKWVGIKDDIVKWVNDKIPEWNESQPEWWNAQKKASIPDWVVSNPEVLRSIRSEDVVKAVQERRGSIINVTVEENKPPKDPGTLRRRSIVDDAKKLKRELNA
ncbi:hypothetical protein TL16_g12697 [Triparma laevis f. inornata]|uniref:Uncharacterized protein n=1 Tax=Triparma laevis f. inornata TaxID=1714386 RepID=A0A9W7BN42_9STRA|nr:hypothetical protein TL16_g12697 [Triparma laevis f. inornata]